MVATAACRKLPAHKNGWTKATRLCCDDYVSCWFWLAPLVAAWLLLAVGVAVAFNAWLFFPSARVALRRQPAWFRAVAGCPSAGLGRFARMDGAVSPRSHSRRPLGPLVLDLGPTRGQGLEVN